MRATVTGRHTDPIRLLLAGTEEWLGRTHDILERADERTDCVLASTIDDAIDELAATAPPYHAVIVAQELERGAGLELIEHANGTTPSVPVVLHPASGSERLAGEAVAKGIAAYVPWDEHGRLPERVFDAVERAEAARDRFQLAARFESAFDAPDRYAWVLDATGRIVAANAQSLELIDDTDDWLGEPFAESPWCARAVGDEIERAIEDVHEERSIRIDIDEVPPGHENRITELLLRPIRDRSGTVAEILVEAEDASRQRRREIELRRSERLHRVTLNNMTDTVLVTDDDGEFVYVCPNVHFIFGYSVEEVHELETIDELLTPDLFDPDRLDEKDVLTNIECETTDKSGQKRTLLVNVKRVSIQGGTLLFSCRDVTKRKERERALTTLHGTARELLYAETGEEIARTLVADTTEALNADGAAFYRFDDENAVLRPVAVTDGMEALHGPLPELAPDANSNVGHAFIEGELSIFADIRDSDRLTNPSTDVRGCVYAAVGAYGVLAVASERPDNFDEIAVEIADLVAATAEAAFDRVEREAELRGRDRKLQRQNERLVRSSRINDLIREVARTLVRAESREHIEHSVCASLTDAGRFGFAWIATGDVDGLVPRAIGGSERGYVDAIYEEDVIGDEPVGRTARTGEPTVVTNVAAGIHESRWRREALSRGIQSVISVPLTYEGVRYGILAVYAVEAAAFDEDNHDVFVELGELVAAAIGSHKRKDALLEGSTTELEYETDDPGCLPYAIARRANCSITLEGGIQQVEEGVLAFLAVDGASIDHVASVAAEFTAVEEVVVVDERSDGGTLRLKLSSPFIATVLADHGAVLRHLTADADTARLTIDVPGSVSTRTVEEVVGTVYNDWALVAQRDRDRRFVTDRVQSELVDKLTDRQLEVARTAYHSGYYESPRENTGEEVATILDISPATFYQTNRRIHEKVFSLLFDGE